MARLIVYYAHPGHKYSHVNRYMARAAAGVEGITYVDLYADYPRFDIDVEVEQRRLLDHDVILFQFPLFWYSTPSIIKEWQDLVLEHGFAYGAGGDALDGKRMMLAVTAAGPDDAYTPGGFQHFELRTFLTPLEQTARLCKMRFAPPYVLYSSLKAPGAGLVDHHVNGYRRLLEAIRDDRYDFDSGRRRVRCWLRDAAGSGGGLIMDGFLLLAFLFLIAGVIAVPIASRLGLGSVLGYLLAGIAISPLLQQLHVDVVSIQHFAEFGVVMMLFLVGLELEPRMLWAMRDKLLGLGGLQVTVTAALVTGIAMLFGQPWSIAVAIGLVFSLSSTAIVLQTLNEKGLMKSDGGQSSFSVLLFQDIAVIPMLAFVPLLALPELSDVAATAHEAAAEDGHSSLSLVERLSGWQRALVTVGAIAFVVVVGSYLTRPIFRFIAMARLRELFTAAALLMVIAIALLMVVVGLSPALGTFLAGVVLANSEYRHELESDIDPFKGLLLGLFFITVGAAMRFDLLLANFGNIVAMTLGLMALKAMVLYVLSRIFRIGGCDRWLFTLGLAQAGEFGFVLLSFTVANSVIPAPLAEQLLLVVALSMLLTPALFIIYEKLIAPRFDDAQSREADEIDETGTVIVAGHGRFGGIVNRILLSAGFKTVVLDYQSEQLEMLRKFGVKVFFGDAMRPDLLHAAGIEEARMLVIAIDQKESATELVRYVKQQHPHVYIVARAMDRHHVYELWAAGARDIIRETFDSSLRAGRSALEALGVHPYDAERQVRGYVLNDRKQMYELAAVYDPDVPAHENDEYVEKAKAFIDRYQQAMQGNSAAFASRLDRGWVPPTLDDVQAETEGDAEIRERDI